jgi:hypothetical protein
MHIRALYHLRVISQPISYIWKTRTLKFFVNFSVFCFMVYSTSLLSFAIFLKFPEKRSLEQKKSNNCVGIFSTI